MIKIKDLLKEKTYIGKKGFILNKSFFSDEELNNIKNELSCSCWGYIAHRKCKHIREVSSEIVA